MLTQERKKRLCWQLIQTPEDALEYLNLVYADETALTIKRVRRGRGFSYSQNGCKIDDTHTLDRIATLVIPPAWQNVKIASLPNAHLQAVGLDEKNRKQYRYHSKWSQIRNQTKFYKMYAFGKALPAIRKQVDKDLRQRHFTKTKVLALIVRLLEETHMRIGNQEYAKKNKTYGLSTLRSRHVDFDNHKMRLEFIGKRGKLHKVTIKNKRLIALVNKCEEIPGWELFKYYDSNGVKQTVDSTMVNDYLQNISNDYFTAKDYRTWSGSLICFESLMQSGLESDEKQNVKNILDAVDACSKALGNTRNTSRTYYIHPYILTSYKDGNIKKAFNYAHRNSNKKQDYFTSSEAALLRLISEFNISF